MGNYYLVSQLPSLDGIGESTPIPISEERFLELCKGFLKEKSFSEIKNLTLVPSLCPIKSNSVLIEAWNTGERNLRLALGKARAQKQNKPFDFDTKSLPIELIKVASTAVEIESPLEAEIFLNQYRLKFLETLRPMDNFSEDFVFYYGLKLKLILRIKQFDTNLGKTAYKNIYNSILNEERLEAIQ